MTGTDRAGFSDHKNSLRCCPLGERWLQAPLSSVLLLAETVPGPQPVWAAPWIPRLRQGLQAEPQQREASHPLVEQQVLQESVQVCRLQERAFQAWPEQQVPSSWSPAQEAALVYQQRTQRVAPWA